jgi:hypothetical protein
MAGKWRWMAAAIGLSALSGAASASGDLGCSTQWKLVSRTGDCANRAMLAPGNDTRVNLLLLLRSRSGIGSAGLTYPDEGWEGDGLGHTFLDWRSMWLAFYPAKGQQGEEAAFSGSRCASLSLATPAFKQALGAAREVPQAERSALIEARAGLEAVCSSGSEAPAAQWPAGITSAGGQAWLGYLTGSRAFYAGRWDEARGAFAGLRSARDAWLAETAAYMLGRVDLNAAIEKSFGEYGNFQGAKATDQAALGRAAAALAAYLQRYPQGRYAASAQGLQRRVLWLSGDVAGLAREYERLLGSVRADSVDAALLVQEVDHKLLFPDGEAQALVGGGAMLQAVAALLDLRSHDRWGDARSVPGLSAAALAARQQALVADPELAGFIEASEAFYGAGDMRRVLALIPDDARRTSFSELAFSRQMLRGLALAALGDRNETGFWREMLGGAKGLWQRPTVELALAMNLERSGKLAEVFAAGSPITDSTLRIILLGHSAGPGILRVAALDKTRPAEERRAALFALLDKQLARGDYAGFGESLKIRLPAPAEETNDTNTVELLKAFTAGNWSDGYPCPAIAETARRLAANPSDGTSRLCVGEFRRINGFDSVDRYDRPPAKDELGGASDMFPGKSLMRGDIYASVMADPRAPSGDRAYALYRAVMCYAPGDNNACGNADVPKAQRRAWFERLKREHPSSPWTQRLRYYW